MSIWYLLTFERIKKAPRLLVFSHDSLKLARQGNKLIWLPVGYQLTGYMHVYVCYSWDFSPVWIVPNPAMESMVDETSKQLGSYVVDPTVPI